MRRLLWVALMLSTSMVLRAAEPSPAPAPVTATAPPAKEASAPMADRGDKVGSSASDEAAATLKANERFNPSEKISEDLSVSFPSDI